MGMMETIEKLSRDIGARPAGTEEEQRASLFIAEKMHDEIGLPAEIEDFEGEAAPLLPKLFCLALAGLSIVLAIVVPFLGFVSLIISALIATVFVLDAMGKPILSGRFGRSASQNVVARYTPPSAFDATSPSRKVVFLARYDSGKVDFAANGPFARLLPYLGKFEIGTLLALPLILLFRNVLFLNFGGFVGMFFTVLLIIDMVFLTLSLVMLVITQLAPYNEGANSNASGVAVMMEVARQVMRGEVTLSAQDDASDYDAQGTVHGLQAAQESGFVPEGAQLIYENKADSSNFETRQSEGERLAAAKDAIAALTGAAVDSPRIGDLSDNMVRIAGQPDTEPAWDTYREIKSEFSAAGAAAEDDFNQAYQTEAGMPGDKRSFDAANQYGARFSNGGASGKQEQIVWQNGSATKGDAEGNKTPDWFIRAQEQAKRTGKPAKPARKSRYATALDMAMIESAGHFQQAQDALNAQFKNSLPVKDDVIREVRPPAAERIDAPRSSYAFSTAFNDDAVFTPSAPPVEQITIPQNVTPLEGATAIGIDELLENGAATKRMQPETVKYSVTETLPPENNNASAQDTQAINIPEQVFAKEEPKPLSAEKPSVEAAHLTQDHLEQTRSQQDYPQQDYPQQDYPQQDYPQQGHPQQTYPQQAPANPVYRNYDYRAPEHDTSVYQENLNRTIPQNAVQGVREDYPQQPIAYGRDENASLFNQAAEESLVEPRSVIQPAPIHPALDRSALADPLSAAESAPLKTPAHAATPTAPRLVLPSISGSFEAVPSAPVFGMHAAGSFSVGSATGAFAPLENESLQIPEGDSMFVDDADDSHLETQFTAGGALTGPGYVEMPKSKFGKFFDKFRSKSKEPEPSSTHEWLQVEDDFDARTVGAKRGSWESFRNDDDDWNGGGISLKNIMNRVKRKPAEEDLSDDMPIDEEAAYDDYGYYPDEQPPSHPSNFFDSTAYSASANPFANAELEAINRFHGLPLDTEMWFVALGSELGSNSGTRMFLKNHAEELRGAFVIELDSLGAGTLSVSSKEGWLKPTEFSSRVKRYIAKTKTATGISAKPVDIPWMRGSAACAANAGFQAMHIVGMDGMKPAYFGQKDDCLENIDQEKLSTNTRFVIELLKNI